MARLDMRGGSATAFVVGATLALVAAGTTIPSALARECPGGGITCVDWWEQRIDGARDTAGACLGDGVNCEQQRIGQARDTVDKNVLAVETILTALVNSTSSNVSDKTRSVPGAGFQVAAASSAVASASCAPWDCVVPSAGVASPAPSTDPVLQGVADAANLVPHPRVPPVEPEIPPPPPTEAPSCEDLAAPLGGLLGCPPSTAGLQGASALDARQARSGPGEADELRQAAAPAGDAGDPNDSFPPGLWAASSSSSQPWRSSPAALAVVDLAPERAPAILGVMVALLAAFPMLALLARRLSPSVALRHPARAAALDILGRRPGLTASGLARELGIDRTTALYHLRVLRRFGMVEVWREGSRDRYFPVGRVEGEMPKRLHSSLTCDNVRRVLDVLAVRPGTSLNALSAELQIPKSTVKWHVDQLRRRGVLDAGKRLAPAASAALPSAGPPTAGLRAVASRGAN